MAQSPSVRALALPVEHGGWGMLGEPLAMGLALAPTRAGAAMAAAAVAAFLARHPLKIALSDWRRGTRAPRTRTAAGLAAAYGAAAVGGLALVASVAPAVTWVPLAIAAPLAAIQLAYDVRLAGRALVPEALGSVALAATAPALMLAGGWGLAAALTAWALLAARSVASVVYVRTRLRRDRDMPAPRSPAIAAHVAALVGAAAAAAAGWAPWLAVVAFAALLARAAHGLSAGHRRLRPQAVGMAELAYGIGTAVLLAAGYAAR